MSADLDLSCEVLAQVRCIVPSRNHGVAYYPCRTRMRDGSVHERVYLVDADAYARWALPGQTVLNARDVAWVEESHQRLPAEFANSLYAAGESGMGYCLFTLRFRDGTEQRYLTGNVIDFLAYPQGYGPADVVHAEPHGVRTAEGRVEGLPYQWCPVSGLREMAATPPWWAFWRRVAARSCVAGVA
jgi:hypothetical protein